MDHAIDAKNDDIEKMLRRHQRNERRTNAPHEERRPSSSDEERRPHLGENERGVAEVWTRVMGYHRPINERSVSSQTQVTPATSGRRRIVAEQTVPENTGNDKKNDKKVGRRLEL